MRKVNKMIKKLLCLIGIHEWRYVKYHDDKYRFCKRCPRNQQLVEGWEYYGTGVSGPKEQWVNMNEN